MAFYIQHTTPANAKEKVHGFSTQQQGQQTQNQNQNGPPSPTSTFDPSSLFFNGPIFPDAFRNPSSNPTNMDFTDTLLSMIPNDNPQHQHNPPNTTQQQPQQPPNLAIPHNVFDMAHYPAHLSSFHQQHHEEAQQDSPASLQTTHSFFADGNGNGIPGHGPFGTIPQYLNHRSETPATSVNGGIGSPSDSSPYPTHASHARIHGHRSPSVGPRGVSVSRSRSRSRTSKPPPATRNTIGSKGAKRQSISSTPEEPATSPPPPPSRPQAIVIPSHPHPHHSHSHSTGHLGHHEFTTQLNTLGPHPISPLGLHSTQTAPPSAWFVPQTGNQSSVEPSFTIPSQANPNDPAHPQSFASAFSTGATPRSLSLGAVKPGTPASASVLAGSLGTPKDAGIVGGSAPMDAATKQAAILSEKRRRRRESHNAVERRRRDNINEKISELSTLLPECLLDSSGPNGASVNPIPTTAEDLLPSGNNTAPVIAANDEDGKESAGMKANKGIILRKSVEYIRYLQQLVRVQASRNRELESQLAHYRGGPIDPNSQNDGNMANSPFSGLDSMNGMSIMDDDGMSMNGILANLSPEDATYSGNMSSIGGLPNLPESPSEGTNTIGANKARMDTSPSVGSGDDDEDDEENERGRGAIRNAGRGRFGGASQNTTNSSSGAPKKTRLRIRNGMLEEADESALSDGEGVSVERMAPPNHGSVPMDV